jgi:hypothetical protein
MAKRGYKATEPIIRFNQKYIVDEETNCWNWIASLSKFGYGKFSLNRSKWIFAHRFSYEYFNHNISDDLFVCHKCDNRKCVNPKHLFLGTAKDNMVDCKNKNRTYKPKGILMPGHKLTNDDVIQIKKELLNYSYGDCVKLSKKYNVDSRTISNIKTGINWNHIQI